MERTISNFIDVINRQGFVDTTKYAVYVFNGKGNELPESSTMYCTNIAIPGMSINPVQRYDAGPIRNIPIEVAFSEAAMEFYCSQDFYEYEYFYNWMNYIYGADKDNMSNIYRLPYYNDIIGNVMITSLDKQMNPVKNIVFYEAYPSMLSEISFSHTNNPGEPAKFSVTITYHHWEMQNYNESISYPNERQRMNRNVVRAPKEKQTFKQAWYQLVGAVDTSPRGYPDMDYNRSGNYNESEPVNMGDY